MKLTKVLLAVLVSATFAFVSCKPKEEDIKANIEKALKADPMMASTTVDVHNGIATIGGMCKDDQCKAHCESTAASVKGVKSVVNNCSIAPPPMVAEPASVNTVLDAATQQRVKDGIKDIKGVTVEFSEDKAMLSGQVTKADRMKIMQILASAKVKSDVSKLTDKK